MNLGEARTAYFRDNGFGDDGGYSNRWVTVYLFGLPVVFPNSQSRRRAVVYHDLHHILTGYQTNNLGEAEISAWELGSGCSTYWFAIMINTFGLSLGMFKSPSRVFRAFLRGRSVRNLYGRPVEPLLSQDVESVRTELGFHEPIKRTSLADLVWFSVFVSVNVAAYILIGLGLAWVFSWVVAGYGDHLGQ